MRTLVWLFCTLAIAWTATGADNPLAADKPKIETFDGEVVPLADLLKKKKIDLDPDAAALAFALETKDGKVYPLVKDAGGRLFAHDKRLLRRPMRIRAILIPEIHQLQVMEVQSLKDGKAHEVYYWCEVCAIRRASLEKTGVCECCGGQMELRETPISK